MDFLLGQFSLEEGSLRTVVFIKAHYSQMHRVKLYCRSTEELVQGDPILEQHQHYKIQTTIRKANTNEILISSHSPRLRVKLDEIH